MESHWVPFPRLNIGDEQRGWHYWLRGGHRQILLAGASSKAILQWRGRSISRESRLLRDQSSLPGLGRCSLSGQVFHSLAVGLPPHFAGRSTGAVSDPSLVLLNGSVTELDMDVLIQLWAGAGTVTWSSVHLGAFSPEMDGESQLVSLLTSTGSWKGRKKGDCQGWINYQP